MSEGTVRELAMTHFRHAGLDPVSIEVRTFPGETIVIVEVDTDYDRAISLASELDEKIENGFVTVRQSEKRPQRKRSKRVKGVHDDRMTELI